MNEFGVDTSRIALFFFAPSDKEILWSNKSVKGSKRFIEKLWSLFAENSFSSKKTLKDFNSLNDSDKELVRKLHQTIKRYSTDFEKLQFNTAIASMMEYLNDITQERLDNSEVGFYIADNFNKLLAPFAPHIAEEINERLGFSESIFKRGFPEYNKSLAEETNVTYAIQILGKLRGTIELPKGLTQIDVQEKAILIEGVSKYLEGKEIKKVIFVQDKIVNFVV